MAYYLSKTTSGTMQMPSGSADIADGQDFSIKFACRFPAAVFRVLGRASGSSYVRFDSTTRIALRTTGTASAVFNFTGIDTSIFNEYEIKREGTLVSLYANGVGSPLATATLAGAFSFNRMFADVSSGGSANGDVKYIELSKSGALTNRWENITGVGVELSDSVGNLPFSQQGAWPTDDSEWVFYDAGGGDVAASIAAAMPQMSIAASASVANPAIAASVAFNMPQMQVASSGDVVAPAVSASITFAMPQISVAASADNIAPTIAASAALTMPQMQVAVSGNVLGVGNSAAISFAMPQMSVAASGSQTVPAFSATIAATMPQMAIVTAADVIGVAGVAANISLTMPQMAVGASAEKTTPVISASVSFTMPQMSVYALSGEFDYFSGEGSHIEYLAQSSHIETVATSTHIEYTL